MIFFNLAQLKGRVETDRTNEKLKIYLKNKQLKLYIYIYLLVIHKNMHRD